MQENERFAQNSQRWLLVGQEKFRSLDEILFQSFCILSMSGGIPEYEACIFDVFSELSRSVFAGENGYSTIQGYPAAWVSDCPASEGRLSSETGELELYYFMGLINQDNPRHLR